jgi:hypothetical protein
VEATNSTVPLQPGTLAQHLQAAQLPQLQGRYPNLQALFASCSDSATALAQAVGMGVPSSLQLKPQAPAGTTRHPTHAHGTGASQSDSLIQGGAGTGTQQGSTAATPQQQAAAQATQPQPGQAAHALTTASEDGLLQDGQQPKPDASSQGGQQDGLTWQSLRLPDPAVYGDALLTELGEKSNPRMCCVGVVGCRHPSCQLEGRG